MSKMNAKIALTSLALLGASMQVQAEDLSYESLGTGEEIREDILADNSDQSQPGDYTDQEPNNTPQTKKENPNANRKPSKNGNGNKNGNGSGKQSTEQKCGKGTCAK